MATNHTTNYALNLWEPTDKFVREEFNENTSKIDAALFNHRAGELIASVTVEEETNSLELDISTVDWSRYSMALITARSDSATGYDISIGSSNESCAAIFSAQSNISGYSYIGTYPNAYHATMVVPVLYSGDHLPVAFGVGFGLRYTTNVGYQSILTGGAGQRPLKECKNLSLRRYDGQLQPGDQVIMWGIK